MQTRRASFLSDEPNQGHISPVTLWPLALVQPAGGLQSPPTQAPSIHRRLSFIPETEKEHTSSSILFSLLKGEKKKKKLAPYLRHPPIHFKWKTFSRGGTPFLSSFK